MITDDRARPKALECSYPDTITYRYWLAEESEIRVRPIMVSVTKVSALANADVIPDGNKRQVIYPNALPKPDIVAEPEKPRILY